MKKDLDHSRLAKVSIERDGIKYSASYYLEKGVLTVISEYGRKSTQLGGSMADSLARILLGELINNKK